MPTPCDYGMCSECDTLCAPEHTFLFHLSVDSDRRMCAKCYTRAALAHAVARGLAARHECALLAVQLTEVELEKSQTNEMRRPDPLFNNKPIISRAEKARNARDWFMVRN